MREIGLFFGSFNPIHNGHLMLAQYVRNFCGIDEVWFVVSPQNPFKKISDLADESHRLTMAELAIGNDNRMQACDIEVNLPKPSYTVRTLEKLREMYPDDRFTLIMGGDNIIGFDKWREYEKIIEHHRIVVYPRPHCDVVVKIEGANIEYVDAPLLDISSTALRQWISQGKSIRHYTPDNVIEYIDSKGLYKN
ncbi:MAG: nicotinate-nucleotide adenylyltransferase [Bacteroidales bacterium]|nr:nicotinate-nucleotide adenylyltransferase [Bacteroidales bacterium]